MTVLLLAIIFISLYKCKIITTNGDSFSQGNVNSYRGILAFLIMMAHIQTYVGQDDIFDILLGFAYIFVAWFYFTSGYGLYISNSKKENYLKGFLPKRLLIVYIPYVLTNVFYIIYASFANAPFKIIDAVKTAFNLSFRINSTSWFIVSIMIFYIAFYVVFKFLRQDIAKWVMLAFFVCYVLFCIVNEYAYFWYASTFAFPLGVIWASYKKQIDKFIYGKKILLFIVGVVLTLIGFRFPQLGKAIGGVYGEFIVFITACVGIAFVFEVISSKILFKNKILDFLSSISLELYLVHSAFVKFFKLPMFNIENKYLYILVCVVLSLISATLVNYISRKIYKFILTKTKLI